MKKIVCLIIALMLVVSLCAVTSVAFAEETSTETPAHAEIIFHQEIFDNLPQIVGMKKLQDMNKQFSLDNSWVKDEEKVAQIFENIDYKLKTDNTSSNEYAVETGKDKIYWEYCSPSKEYKDKWVRSELRSTISAASTGWWAFRYVVTDSEGSTITSDEAEKHVLFRTPTFFIYFADESKPEITALHADMTKAMQDGIKVGSTYSIKTNLSISDNSSSTTTTYKVYKKVNGVWDMDDPIYDSVTREVKEGYEDCISTSGVITMLASDVLPNKEPVYKIIYTVTDAVGYSVTTLGDKELTLFAVAEQKKLTTAEIWQIVLYVIAGLSAIGIVVVLCIKPKEKAPETGRTAPKKSGDDKDSDNE